MSITLNNALQVYQEGGVLAYPTEAIYGLGCDPDNESAVHKLLALKERPIEKGLILLAGNYSQLLPYVDDSKIPQDKRFSVLSRWPNGITQVLPANNGIAHYLTGQFSTIAVRVTSQPDVVALCNATGKPIVSTSCNLTGCEPATRYDTIDEKLLPDIDYVIQGKTLGFTKPSTIINGLTGEKFRI